MTGSASDPPDWQPHIRNKPRREALAKRFRDPKDPFNLVLVRDMWLTGFDAPSLHTIYLDKPMRAHGLMQVIARVNRVFRDKPGGLVVDYLGLAHELKEALATYTESGGTGRTAIGQDEAVAVMLEKYEVCCGRFHGFDRSRWTAGTPQERLALLPAAQEHILAQDNGKDRCVRAVRDLSQAFALAVPHQEGLAIRDDVAFFQAVQAVLSKRAPGEARPEEDLDHAIRQIISRAVAPEGVVDIFAAAGLAKPDISILLEEFLAEVRGMPHKNLAIELLQRLLKGEIATRRRKNVVQARSFAEMLEQAIRRYQNRAIETAQVIEELIALAREMREANARGEKLHLSEEELAFYDALETNDSAVKVLGDETLRTIARELAAAGMDRVLWSAGGTAEEVAEINGLGFLTSRYDIYQDLMDPTQFPKLHGVHNDWTTDAWPTGIVRRADGDWVRGWQVRAKDGTMIPCAVLCDRLAPDWARRRIREDLARRPFRARFIDTTTASPWRECYDPNHPMTRTESRAFKMELLKVVSHEFNLVCGSETGHDAAVPFVHYFEGMLSLGPFRVPDAGRDIMRKWTEVPERVARFQTGHRYRLPLWELVYHDCVVAQWYWGDYNNKLPALWRRRDLWNALYGTPPMYMFNRAEWNRDRDRFLESYRIATPVHRRTMLHPMTNHRRLTPDGSVQQSVFGDGTVVTVNFGEQPWRLPDGRELAPETADITRGAPPAPVVP